MRLVKGPFGHLSRRRRPVEPPAPPAWAPRTLLALTLASSTSLTACSGCVDDDAPPPAPTAETCEPTVTRPVSPRIVEVKPDGTLAPGPACGSANCLGGTEGVWAYRGDGDGTIHVRVGDQTLDVAPRSTSPLSAVPALRGLAFGCDVVVVDGGGGKGELIERTGRTPLTLPSLAPREQVATVSRVDGGVVFQVKSRDHIGERLVIVAPTRTAPPSPDVAPLGTGDAVIAWFRPARSAQQPGGPAPAALTSTKHGALALPADVSPLARAYVAGTRHVVVAEKLRGWVALDAQRVIETPPHTNVSALPDGDLIAIDTWPPGAVYRYDVDAAAGASWTPLLGGREGIDFTGAPLPPGSRVERITAKVHDVDVLFIQRLRLASCNIEDRLILVEGATQKARVLATGGDAMRLHPTWAGDRFRFVEADIGE